MTSAWILLILLLYTTELTQASSREVPYSYQLSHLLKPQLSFDINLFFGDFISFSDQLLPPSLLRSIEYLVDNQTPFRLYYNSARQNESSLIIRSSKHAEHQVAHLVFVILSSKDDILDLLQVFRYCLYQNHYVSSTIFKDFLELIVDASNLNSGWGILPRYNIPREYLPLHFFVFFWKSFGFRFSRPFLVRETCKCDDAPWGMFLNSDFGKISDQNGIQILKDEVRAEKINFRGRKLIIFPNLAFFYEWEEWEELQRRYSLRSAHAHIDSTLGGLLFLFSTRHNFTFDTLEWRGGSGRAGRSEGVIIMSIHYQPEDDHDCYLPPMPFADSGFTSTLSFSQPPQTKPFELLSIAAPFSHDLELKLVLASASIIMILILLLLSGSWNVAEVSLCVLAGLVGKSLTPTTQRFPCVLCYAIWLLFVGFTSMGYTNVLQSIVVVPRIQHSALTFEEMLHQNFTFGAFDLSYLQSLRGHLTKEETDLLERAVQYNMPDQFSWGHFIEHFAEGRRSALVTNSHNLKHFEFIPATFAVDLLVGKERFFNFFHGWGFADVERASLLADSVENFREVGFLSYFPWLHSSIRTKMQTKMAKKELLEGVGSRDDHETLDGRSSVSLKDGLVSESFVLFLYGISFAVVGFMSEILPKLFLQGFAAVKRKLREQGIAWKMMNPRLLFKCYTPFRK